ncbi:glycosyltransferase [Candidatus Daviesbacteria bacterium]|nr:glycosyltransferase [Candidatus Daviesbacteria bacterium]
MPASPSLSIIIPTRNEQKNILRCLASVKRQKYSGRIETIVVDSNSSDQTAKIARRLATKVILGGFERSEQRNIGAKASVGQYLVFIDADMKLSTPELLAEATKIASQGKFIIAFPEQSVGSNFWEKSIALERNLYKHEQVITAARVYPRKLFFDLGGFDEKLVAGEDWDLSINAQKLGYKLIYTKREILHYEHISSLGSFLRKKNYYVRNISLFKNKHPEEFTLKSSLKIRLGIFLKNWTLFLRDPLHSLGFLFLKTLVWYDWKKSENA